VIEGRASDLGGQKKDHFSNQKTLRKQGEAWATEERLRGKKKPRDNTRHKSNTHGGSNNGRGVMKEKGAVKAARREGGERGL